MKPSGRNRESGFAMLFVFLMSAIIAITLYQQLPRAAFESQRAKEELLQERGEQYIRAIQLYVAKWKRYPEDLDALEKTHNQRFLRRRYKDPMTGKDEWRAVHINSMGQLTDSVVQKDNKEKKEYSNTFISELPTMGSTQGTGGETGQNVALRKRPSDQQAMPMPGAGGNVPVDPQQQMNGTPVGNLAVGPNGQPVTQDPNGQTPQNPGPPPPGPPNPDDPGQQQQNQSQPVQGQPVQMQPGQTQPFQIQPGQGQPGQVQPGQVQPGQVQPGIVQPGQAQPGQTQPQYQMNAPGQYQMGQQYQPNQTQPGQQQRSNSGMPYPVPTPPGAAGTPANTGAYPTAPGMQSGRQAAGAPNQGMDLINKILTTPRAPSNNMTAPGVPGLHIGGGLAGFASMKEAPSIKIYNERQKYNEWEFIYDMKKDKRMMGAAAGGLNPNQQQQNQLGGTTLGNTNMPNPMTNSGSGFGSGFGNSNTQNPNQPPQQQQPPRTSFGQGR